MQCECIVPFKLIDHSVRLFRRSQFLLSYGNTVSYHHCSFLSSKLRSAAHGNEFDSKVLCRLPVGRSLLS